MLDCEVVSLLFRLVVNFYLRGSILKTSQKPTWLDWIVVKWWSDNNGVSCSAAARRTRHQLKRSATNDYASLNIPLERKRASVRAADVAALVSGFWYCNEESPTVKSVGNSITSCIIDWQTRSLQSWRCWHGNVRLTIHDSLHSLSLIHIWRCRRSYAYTPHLFRRLIKKKKTAHKHAMDQNEIKEERAALL